MKRRENTTEGGGRCSWERQQTPVIMNKYSWTKELQESGQVPSYFLHEAEEEVETPHQIPPP
jgi:hypothetical protein